MAFNVFFHFFQHKVPRLLSMHNRDCLYALRQKNMRSLSSLGPAAQRPFQRADSFPPSSPQHFPTGFANHPQLCYFEIKCLFKQAGCAAFSTCSNEERLFSKTPLSGHVARSLIPRSLAFPEPLKPS